MSRVSCRGEMPQDAGSFLCLVCLVVCFLHIEGRRLRKRRQNRIRQYRQVSYDQAWREDFRLFRFNVRVGVARASVRGVGVYIQAKPCIFKVPLGRPSGPKCEQACS